MQQINPTWRRAVLAVASAFLLVGADRSRAEGTEKPWDRSVALGLAVAAGNSDSMQFNAAVKAEKIWQRDEWRLGLTGTYGKTDGEVANEQLRAIAQYKWLGSERWYATAVADGLRDAVANIEYRWSIGPGLGYYFIKSDKTRLSGEVGPSYVFEKLDVIHPNQPPPPPPNPNYVTSEERNYPALRAAERFDRQLNESAKLWQQTEIVPRVDDFQDYVLNTEIGAEAALTKTLSLRLVGTHRYYSITSDARRHYDITMVSSLVYKF
jgi:putative salt-induced outer membrane protein YdiY